MLQTDVQVCSVTYGLRIVATFMFFPIFCYVADLFHCSSGHFCGTSQELLNRVEVHNQAMNTGGEKTFLLPMAVAEGSPTHPTYPSGHSINVGSYITALKVIIMPCPTVGSLVNWVNQYGGHRTRFERDYTSCG